MAASLGERARAAASACACGIDDHAVYDPSRSSPEGARAMNLRDRECARNRRPSGPRRIGTRSDACEPCGRGRAGDGELQLAAESVNCSGAVLEEPSLGGFAFSHEPVTNLSGGALDCDDSVEVPSFPIWWTPTGDEWDDLRILRTEIALYEAAVWLDSVIQFLDVLGNADPEAVAHYWNTFPRHEASPRTYFGEFDQTRYLAVRDTLHAVMLILSAQGPFSAAIPIRAGVAQSLEDEEPGLFCDTYAAWSWNGEIGVCLDTLDSASTKGIASLLIHELVHQAGVGHAVADFCAGPKDTCRSKEECLLLAQIEPDKTIKNADSFRFFVREFGLGGCPPHYEWAGGGSNLNGVWQSMWRDLCSNRDPYDTDTGAVCSRVVECPGPDVAFDGNATFKVCRP